MNTGFNDMSIAHRIDEFIFDCSFDSFSPAHENEPELNTFLTTELLPVIDSILNEFDEADIVWRLGQVEIDLGDIPGDDFNTEVIYRVQERLRNKLRTLQWNHKHPELTPAGTLPAQIPAQRLSRVQTDLEKLQDFLLTGRLPWHIDTADRHVHEKMLQQILQEKNAREAWIDLLKRLPTTERAVLINRLVAQFSHRTLENVLNSIVPIHARPTLDFLMVYQQIKPEENALPVTQTHSVNSTWEMLFEILLEPNQSSDHLVSLLSRFVRKIASTQVRESFFPWKKMIQVAERFRVEGKISSTLYDALLSMADAYLRHPHQESVEILASFLHRNDKKNAVRNKIEGIKNEPWIEKNQPPESIDQSGLAKQDQPVDDALYVRILEALRKAKLIDEGFASILVRLQGVERKQRLSHVLQSADINPHLPQLPQAILLDISYVLSAQAALLLERLLAHSAQLYRLPGPAGRITQKRWKQLLWVASLDYLLTKSSAQIEPAAYMQALARGVSDAETESQVTLRAWYAALEQKKFHGAIHTLLRTLISNPSARDKAAGKTPELVEELPEGSAAYRKLRQRLTAEKPTTGQPHLRVLLEELATKHPAQLHQLYQELRNGRYDLTAAQLEATELHTLAEQLLQIESTMDSADRQTFQQAIEQHADQASDRRIYYQLLLEDLLQDREIDLEAIAALSQQTTLPRASDARADWRQQTGTDPATGSTPKQSAKHHAQAGDETLYASIIAALHQAKLIGEQRAAIETDTDTDTQPTELRQRIRDLLRTLKVNDWMHKLPQPSLMDIAYLLAPQAALLNEHLLVQADKLYRVTAVTGQNNRKEWEQRLWAASLSYLLAKDTADITPAAYLQALARGVSRESDPQATLHAWYEALVQSKASSAVHMLLQALVEISAEQLHIVEDITDANRLVAGTGAGPSLSAEKLPAVDLDALLNRTEQTDVTEEIYIDNAGQVLAAPYLPRLFNMLELVEEGAFIDRRAAERAVHLLQFMVNEQTQSPEFQLTLNKILCGVSTGIPICREIEISAHEQETIEGLIRGMIQNWKTIGNTSISGLRETFLQRKGKLQLKEDGMWYLTVEPGVFDMLLDSLPWTFSVIKHAWMDRAIHVTWR